VHEGSSCEFFALAGLNGVEGPDPLGHFYCDHVVFDLFDIAIHGVSTIRLRRATIAQWHENAQKAIRQMHHAVQASRTSLEGELSVSWTANPTEMIAERCGMDTRYIRHNIQLYI